MRGWKTILATIAVATLLSTSLGAAQHLGKLRVHSPRPATQAQQQAEHGDSNRLALVIGNSSYPDADAPLAQIAGDSDTLANALRDDGFDVELVRNATRHDMTRAIARLRARLHPGSTVMIYFGGFGVQSRGDNYLIPVDAKIWTERDVRREGINLEDVLSELKGTGAKVRVAVVDASRRNPYERRFRSYSHGLAAIEAGDNELILTSDTADHVVDETTGQHSVLMTTLVNEMKSARPIAQVFDSTRDAVAHITENRQVPTVSSALTGNVTLGPAAAGTRVSARERLTDRPT